ncbi:MAG: hypothetical protein II715_02580, partial [Clostridia bacterium]|nr:hypothetical protein [Clostridia bacterium]
YTGMELVTVVAEAIRMVNLENGPDHFEYPMTAFSFGNIGIVTIPGEAFAEIGLQLKATPGWDTVLVFGETDGCGGYYPTTDAYEEGGYEARSSRFAPGVGDLLLESGRELLRQVESPVDRKESDHK